MKKTLSVSAICEGSVIDHIPPGEGIRIVGLLNLTKQRNLVTLGLNLPSRTMGYKDLIKVEGREITEEEASQIAIFAPKATLNIIKDFQVVKKNSLQLPSSIKNFLRCPNEKCITNHERIITHFSLQKLPRSVRLTCLYCEKDFSHEII